MARNRVHRLWSKGALAASTVLTVGAGATGWASAQAVISTTGPDSFNSITESNSFGRGLSPFFRFNFADQHFLHPHNNKFSFIDNHKRNDNKRSDSDNHDNRVRHVAFEDTDNHDFSNDNRDNFSRDNGGSTFESVSNNVQTTVRNTNDIRVSNNNPQTAETGDVDVSRNTVVGSVSSGDAANESQANFDVNVSNDTPVATTASSDWSLPLSRIDTTGPDSRNVITASNRETTTVTNTNDITLTNNNRQIAETGDVNVSRNTRVGGVSSGDASNYSSASFDVSVQNN